MGEYLPSEARPRLFRESSQEWSIFSGSPFPAFVTRVCFVTSTMSRGNDNCYASRPLFARTVATVCRNRFRRLYNDPRPLSSSLSLDQSPRLPRVRPRTRAVCVEHNFSLLRDVLVLLARLGPRSDESRTSRVGNPTVPGSVEGEPGDNGEEVPGLSERVSCGGSCPLAET